MLLFSVVGTTFGATVRGAKGQLDDVDANPEKVPEKNLNVEFEEVGAVGNRVLSSSFRMDSNDEKLHKVSEQELKEMKSEIARMDKDSRLASILGRSSIPKKSSEKISVPTSSRTTYFSRNVQSIDGKLSYAPFPRTITGVTLLETYSLASCNAGYDFAYLSRFLIVANGCYGRFFVRTY